MRRTALLLLPLLAACGQLEDNRFSTGSSTLVAASDYELLHALEADAGVVATINPETRDRSELLIGGEPTRIARADERLFVSQRTARSVAVLVQGEEGLEHTDSIAVGAEPVGVVASESGDRIWVASSLSNRVDEIDAQSLEILRSFDVGDEPKWLALHPSDKSLFVGSAVHGRLSRIDLDAGDVERVELPAVPATPFDGGATFDLTPRITGDPSIRFDGKSLAVPVLYVDNVTAVPDPNTDEAEDFEDFGEGQDGYAANGGSRFTGTVVTIPLDTAGAVTTDEAQVISLNGFDEGNDFRSVGGYAASVTFTPDGRRILATMEGSSAVLSVQSMQRQQGFDDGMDVSEPMPMMDGEFGGGSGSFIEFGALARHATDTIGTDAGPRGVAFLAEEQGFVHSFLDRSVANLRVDALPDRNESGLESLGSPLRVNGLVAGSGIEVATSTLPQDVEAGRRLFYAADDSRMSAEGAAVSCATCHHDGRADGVTWTFNEGVRQTPSLAGVVSLTAPVTWTSDVQTVHDEVVTTSQGRMGGSGLASSEADLVAAFIDWSREPDVVRAGELSDSVVRGQALFEREDVACAECHSGASYTDNEAYELYDLESVRTRSLVGISASAPYLHDGSAVSLRAVVERSRDGSMGDTASLSDAQVDDLVAYLESL